jgi:hypothetical protein
MKTRLLLLFAFAIFGLGNTFEKSNPEHAKKFSSIGISETIDSMQMYPNPCAELLKVMFKVSSDDTLSYYTTDVTGKTIAKFYSNKIIKAGTFEINYPVSNLKEGVYIMILESNTKKIASKFIKTGIADSTKRINTMIIIHKSLVNPTVADTQKIEIADASNNNTSLSFASNSKYSKSEIIMVHNNLYFNSTPVDYLEIYDLTGRNTKKQESI